MYSLYIFISVVLHIIPVVVQLYTDREFQPEGVRCRDSSHGLGVHHIYRGD